jgi:hypothetical protein
LPRPRWSERGTKPAGAASVSGIGCRSARKLVEMAASGKQVLSGRGRLFGIYVQAPAPMSGPIFEPCLA